MAAAHILEEIIPIPLLRKIANIREIGADTELIDLLLKKANQPFTLEELITQLGSDQFRQVYINLDPEIQHQIEIIITPLAVLAGPGRRMARKESEIWQKRHLIHQLKTEEIQTPKDTKQRTWEEVTVEIHSRGILTHKTKDQIYWTLRDKRDDATLTLEDKQLLEASAKPRNVMPFFCRISRTAVRFRFVFFLLGEHGWFFALSNVLDWSR